MPKRMRAAGRAGRASGIRRASWVADRRSSESPIWQKLAGGDRRSIGRSNEIVASVLADPRLFDELFAGMLAPDPLVRMRSADAVEKITRTRPSDLQRHKRTLVTRIAQTDQAELRWHVAQMLPRLDLRPRELRRVLDILWLYLRSNSRIVATTAMQALAELAQRHARLRPGVVSVLQQCIAAGSPAMKARGRKLLAGIERADR